MFSAPVQVELLSSLLFTTSPSTTPLSNGSTSFPSTIPMSSGSTSFPSTTPMGYGRTSFPFFSESKYHILNTTKEKTNRQFGSLPNYFVYENDMWVIKFALPLALFLQTLGHVIALRLYKRKRCDSLLFIINYMIADTVLLLYMVTVYSLQPSTCTVVQILYNVSITSPIFAVFLITLKRFVRVIKPLRCSFILTRSREGALVASSWLIVLVIALTIVTKVCELKINLDISFCYYSEPEAKKCMIYIGSQITLDFCMPLLGVLVMYGIMLKESRKAIKKEAFISFLRVNNDRYTEMFIFVSIDVTRN